MYYIIFADLKAYPKGKMVSDIGTYEDFLNSDCQLVVLVVDCTYVTIYSKDKEMLEWLYYRAKVNKFENVQYITKENDSRTRLSVW
jgi:ribosomal protein S16